MGWRHCGPGIAQGQGCLLLGAHIGSFEALRAVADPAARWRSRSLMHEANAARLKAVFDALGDPGRDARP